MIFSQSFLLLLIFPIIAIVLKISIVFLKEKKPHDDIRYLKKDSLLTQAEKKFFSILQEVVGNDYLIFSQVSLLEILSVPSGLSKSQFASSFNKIQSKHIDFLLCEKESMKPMIAIELDDSSHREIKRMIRDSFLNNAFSSAGLPLLHIPVMPSYDRQDLNDRIRLSLDK
jgi:hypothetical protein